MRHYEIVVILNPDCDRESAHGQESAYNVMIEKYKAIITRDGGKVHRYEDWSRPRQYPVYMIKGRKKCHYFLMNFECATAELNELKKKLDYNDHTLRYLITKQKKAITGDSFMLVELKNQSTFRDNKRQSYSAQTKPSSVTATTQGE
jgi:small subunit ribosomal protein S6